MIKTGTVPVNFVSPNFAPPKFDFLEILDVEPGVQDAIRIAIACALNLRTYDYRKPITSFHLSLVERLDCESFTERDAWLFQYMPNLKTLFLQGSDITSTRHFEHMNRLRNLSLAGTRVYDLSPLRELPRLEYLNVERTRVLNSEAFLENAHSVNEYKDFGSWASERRCGGITTVEFRFGDAMSTIMYHYYGTNDPKELAELLPIEANPLDIEQALAGKLSNAPSDTIDGLMISIEDLLYDSPLVDDEDDWSRDLNEMPDRAFFAEKYLPVLEYFSTYIDYDDE